MDIPDPTDLLPHREPFLFIDEIVALDPGVSAHARWTLRPDLDFFRGHFPGNPITPGVLIVEALAQAGGLAAMSLEENEGKLAVFAGIEKVRFRRPVLPGDTLDLITTLDPSIGGGDTISGNDDNDIPYDDQHHGDFDECDDHLNNNGCDNHLGPHRHNHNNVTDRR